MAWSVSCSIYALFHAPILLYFQFHLYLLQALPFPLRLLTSYPWGRVYLYCCPIHHLLHLWLKLIRLLRFPLTLSPSPAPSLLKPVRNVVLCASYSPGRPTGLAVSSPNDSTPSIFAKLALLHPSFCHLVSLEILEIDCWSRFNEIV